LSERSNFNLGYYTFTPRRMAPARLRLKRIRLIVVVAAVVAAAATTLQLLYPWDLTAPGSHIGKLQLGGLSVQAAEEKLNQTYQNWNRVIKAKSHSYSVGSGDIGLGVDAVKTANGPLSYPWWQRLIPGSFLWRFINSDIQPELLVQESKLKSFTDQIQKENLIPYTNASIVADGQKFSVKPDQAGQEYPSAVTAVALGREFFAAQGDLQLSANVIKPAITAGDAQGAADDAQKIVSAPPTYAIGGKTGQISKDTIAAWLAFNANEQKHRLETTISAAKVEDFLNSLYPYIYTVPAGTVAQVDGQNITSLPGDDANVINVASAVTSFRAIVDKKGTAQNVTATQIAVSSAMRNNRQYSKSQPGLQVLLQDLVKQKGNYGIALQELGGKGWSASASGDKLFITASTYKLFVAYALLTNIEAGSWSWNDTIAGETVSDCFDDMIIYSDNTCAEAFGHAIGWNKIESEMHNLGLTHTTLGAVTFTSTANDELLYMAKLGRGEILSQASRDRLIGLMKRQVYRSGIPAGTGLPVADKVGFLDGILNDAALVYDPNGTYAVVIMSNGSSWGDIADAAAQIQKLLN